MVNDTQLFNERVNRIQSARRGRSGGMGFVVHADGVVSPIGKPSSRLRFGFPLKGLFLGLFVAVAIKAYLMWVLGADVYALQVETLLSGAAFEQVAGLILMPDELTIWMGERYDQIYAFIQGGLAATEAR